MSPKVSVVVPSYNSVHFIEDTVRSILGQSFGDFELVVADHASTDGTWERLQAFAHDPRVRLLQTLPGGGPRANWQRASDAATGEYLKLVCGDDLIDPTCLEEQVAVLDAYQSVTLVSSLRRLIDPRGRVVIRARGLGGLNGPVSGRIAVRRAVVLGSNVFGEPACVLMRRAALETVGGWDDANGYVIDQATFSKIALLGDFHALRQVLASFRLSRAQWSVQLGREQGEHVVAFHRHLYATYGGVLSRTDLIRGNLRARATARARRLAYLCLPRSAPRSGKRDQDEPTPPSSV